MEERENSFGAKLKCFLCLERREISEKHLGLYGSEGKFGQAYLGKEGEQVYNKVEHLQQFIFLSDCLLLRAVTAVKQEKKMQSSVCSASSFS